MKCKQATLTYISHQVNDALQPLLFNTTCLPLEVCHLWEDTHFKSKNKAIICHSESGWQVYRASALGYIVAKGHPECPLDQMEQILSNDKLARTSHFPGRTGAHGTKCHASLEMMQWHAVAAREKLQKWVCWLPLKATAGPSQGWMCLIGGRGLYDTVSTSVSTRTFLLKRL